MPRRSTEDLTCNADLLQDIITFSPYGALSELFVMQAVQAYADEVLAADPATLDNALVSGQAWRNVAADIKRRCDEFYNRHDDAPEPAPVVERAEG